MDKFVVWLVQLGGYLVKWIDGYEGLYAVTINGDVYSFHSSVHEAAKLSGRRMPAGYERVVLCRNGVQKERLVHHLVLETFVGLCPDSMETRHLNGNPSDNRLVNLCWGTPKENGKDKARHGTRVHGEDHGCSVLTMGQVNEIRGRLSSGESHTVIAQDYPVSRSLVSQIARGEKWAAAQGSKRGCGGLAIADD
jgi:hypothetical protein